MSKQSIKITTLVESSLCKSHNLCHKVLYQSHRCEETWVQIDMQDSGSQVSGWRKFCQSDIQSVTGRKGWAARYSSPPIDQKLIIYSTPIKFCCCSWYVLYVRIWDRQTKSRQTCSSYHQICYLDLYLIQYLSSSKNIARIANAVQCHS